MILAIDAMTGFALPARRLLAKFDEYEPDESKGDGKPTVEDLFTRGGYGDPGPMG